MTGTRCSWQLFVALTCILAPACLGQDRAVGGATGRVLRFPDDASVGEVRVQDADLVIPEAVHDFHPGYAYYADPAYLAQAQGEVRIPPGKRVCLHIQGPGATYTRCRSALESLAPDDLYRLDLTSPRVTDALMPLVARQTELRVLYLIGSRVTPRGMKYVTSLPHLEELSLPEGASDRWMGEIAKLASLRILSIWPSHITEAGLRSLRQLPSLEVLGIYGNYRMTNDGVAALRELRRLRHLRLGREGRFTDRAMAHLAAMPTLKVLWLDTPNIGDEGLHRLAESRSLERICLLRLKNITDRGVAHLTKLPRLVALNVRNSQVTDEGLRHLKEIKTLEVLELPAEGITDTGLNCLAQLPRLRSLYISRVHHIDPSQNKDYYTDAGLEALSKVTSLEHLSIGSIGITDKGVGYVSRLPRLRYLHLGGCGRTTDRSLVSIGRLSQLEELYIYKGQFTIAGLKSLNGLANLKVLSVEGVIQDGSGLDLSGLKSLEDLTIGTESKSDAPLTDADLTCLAGLRQLRRFQVIRLASMPHGLTDRGLAHLSGLANMECLSIGGPTLTDDGLAHLRGMKKLDMLNIYGGRFTNRGLRRLAQLESLQSLTLIGDHDFTQEGIRLLFRSLPRLHRLKGGRKWPGTEILREKALATPSRTRSRRAR